jgi:hypothetical protein
MVAILKGILVLCVAVYAFALSQMAWAAKPDLEGALLQNHGVCLYNATPMPCAVYKKGDVLYLLYASQGEIVLIYRVKKGAAEPYGPKDTELLWTKGDKRTDV